MISLEKMKAALPGAKSSNVELFYESLIAAMEEFEINTIPRIAGFLSQCAHESGYFSAVRENLNYSADGLRKVFPKYFRTVSADSYHRQPERIANRVYANRMGNGDERSGEGWRFRGRGLIQLTGKNNYIACGDGLGVDLIETPEYLETPEGAARSAAWFWWKNGLNALADKKDILGMTKKINGGTNGLEDRKKKYSHALKVLGG
jgi:putative chitinase